MDSKKLPNGSFLLDSRILRNLFLFASPIGALGTPVSQSLLFTATFALSDDPPHVADDGLNSQLSFPAEAEKYRLSLPIAIISSTSDIFKSPVAN